MMKTILSWWCRGVVVLWQWPRMRTSISPYYFARINSSYSTSDFWLVLYKLSTLSLRWLHDANDKRGVGLNSPITFENYNYCWVSDSQLSPAKSSKRDNQHHTITKRDASSGMGRCELTTPSSNTLLQHLPNISECSKPSTFPLIYPAFDQFFPILVHLWLQNLLRFIIRILFLFHYHTIHSNEYSKSIPIHPNCFLSSIVAGRIPGCSSYPTILLRFLNEVQRETKGSKLMALRYHNYFRLVISCWGGE